MEPKRDQYLERYRGESRNERADSLSKAIRDQLQPEMSISQVPDLNPLEISAFFDKLTAFENATTHLPFLASRIRENVAFQHEQYIHGQLHYFDFHKVAAEHIMTPKDFLMLYQKWIERVLGQCHAFVAVPTYVFIDQILQDFRWRTQHEVFRSGGKLNPESRAQLERHLFGYPIDPTINASRPVYGYLSPNFHGIISRTGSHPPNNSTRVYGEIACKVKRPVYARMTVSGQDTMLYEECQPTPYSAAHSMSFYIDPLRSNRISEILGHLHASTTPEIAIQKFLAMNYYAEVQIHGGLRLSEIESLHISEDNRTDPSEIQALKNAMIDFSSQYGSQYDIRVYDYSNRNTDRKNR